MCGIAGYYHAPVADQHVNRVLSALRHRGPDSEGTYQSPDGETGLLHTRLSIIDLSALGTQPYVFENLVLTFNGEIYNYVEVRTLLQKRGYQFVSHSDTEVLIKAFHCWREKCVDHLIGMFAFAVYDQTRDELFLFRDRVGVKPLYYYAQGECVFFASEVRALTAFPITTLLDEQSVSLYFRYGFVPSPRSIWTGIHKLAPAHYLKVSRGKITKERYWACPAPAVQTHRPDRDYEEELESLLESSFIYRMVADVPVGVFLSGGIDSSLLTSVLQKNRGDLRTFTIGFDEPAFDESVHAKRVADHLQTRHTQHTLALPEAKKILDSFYTIYDEPFADTSGIPTSFVAQIAKQQDVKVVLSADGGDELFGGYTHYRTASALLHRFSRLPRAFRKQLANVLYTVIPPALRARISFANFEHRLYALEEMLQAQTPIDFFEALLANQTKPEIARLSAPLLQASLGLSHARGEAVADMMAWDFEHYLPDDLMYKVDRATMYHGVECREPFLDHRLIEFAAALPMHLKLPPQGAGKRILRNLLSRHLPTDYFDRKKQGFSIPLFKWFQRDLDAQFAEAFSHATLASLAPLNADEATREYKKYRQFKKASKEYNMEKMWRMLSFVKWCQTYLPHAH